MQTSRGIMSAAQLERIRLPAAFLLILIAAFVLWPRGTAGPAVARPTPGSSVIVGQPGGEVVAEAPTPAPSPIPTATAPATPTPTVAPPPPPPVETFTAEILACRSISGASCNGQIERLPPGTGSFTALVRFTDAIAGDAMNAILSGPGGTLAGTPYPLRGSGDGYFWAEFVVGSLPAGDYVLTATRNGVEVAATGLQLGGG
jgi:hypothetical protein